MTPPVIWTPPDDAMETSEVGRFIRWTGRDFKSFADLHEWSVTDIEGFWGAIADFFAIDWRTKPERVLGSADFPGAKWFPGGELNYAEHLLRTDPGRPAVVSYGQGHEPRSLTMEELRGQVARARAGLKRLGVGRGDRVVAYMPNVPETLVAFAACASLGAVWASCAPELGPRSVIDRLSQLGPKVLLTVDGYNFRDKWIDRSAEVAAITAALPTSSTCPPTGTRSSPRTARSSSTRCRSTTRSTCCSRPARRASRRRSSTVTAAS
jgi:acetoacetyl-CoA synthetase